MALASSACLARPTVALRQQRQRLRVAQRLILQAQCPRSLVSVSACNLGNTGRRFSTCQLEAIDVDHFQQIAAAIDQQQEARKQIAIVATRKLLDQQQELVEIAERVRGGTAKQDSNARATTASSSSSCPSSSCETRRRTPLQEQLIWAQRADELEEACPLLNLQKAPGLPRPAPAAAAADLSLEAEIAWNIIKYRQLEQGGLPGLRTGKRVNELLNSALCSAPFHPFAISGALGDKQRVA